jgi:hypothetical protein
MRKSTGLGKTLLLATMMSLLETGRPLANPFESEGVTPTPLNQNLWEPKQFESKAKLKKRNGSKKPRSKR